MDYKAGLHFPKEDVYQWPVSLIGESFSNDKTKFIYNFLGTDNLTFGHAHFDLLELDRPVGDVAPEGRFLNPDLLVLVIRE